MTTVWIYVDTRPRAIRQLIDRNIEELERYGSLPRHVANPSSQGGRPSEENYLNEEPRKLATPITSRYSRHQSLPMRGSRRTIRKASRSNMRS